MTMGRKKPPNNLTDKIKFCLIKKIENTRIERKKNEKLNLSKQKIWILQEYKIRKIGNLIRLESKFIKKKREETFSLSLKDISERSERKTLPHKYFRLDINI